MSSLVILLVIIPFIASAIALFNRFTPHLPLGRSASLVAVSLCLISLFLLFPDIFSGGNINYPLGGWKEPVGISLYMDGLAWITSLIGLIVTLFTLIFAEGEEKYEYKFYFFFLTCLGGMQGVILTQDIFNMFVFFEILSIATYLLIAYPRKGKSILASFNYLLISSLGIGFFLLGIALLYQQTGVLSLKEIMKRGNEIYENSSIFSLALVFLITGIGVKAAFVPLHTWLPDAHAFAPHPVSAILSGVMIKVSFLAIWRLIGLFRYSAFQPIFLWIGVITAFTGVIWTLAQNDCKRLLAYSSISQMGFIIASFGATTSLSLTASFYHILNHSLFKSLLFLSVGAVVYTTGKREIEKLHQPVKKMPAVFISFLIGTLSICGVPFFNGYISKNLIFLSLKKYPFPYFLIFLTSVGTVASFLKLSGIFTLKPKQAKETITAKKVPVEMLIPLVILASLCLLTAMYPFLWTRLISQLILRERLHFDFSFYSSSELFQSFLSLTLGSILYIFIKSSKGRKVLTFIQNIKCGLNNSLLLFVLTLLLFVLLIWIVPST